MNSKRLWCRFVVLALFGCGLILVPTARATVHNVSIGDSYFSPSGVTMFAGDQVKWTWIGSISHSSTSDSGLWDSGVKGNGGTYTRTFPTAGNFPYHCSIHSFMVGSIKVKPPGPDVAITSPKNGTTFNAPAKFILKTTVADSDGVGAVTGVEFFQGGASLTNVTTSPYSASVDHLPVGNYLFSAVATDNLARTATNSIAIHIIPDITHPTLTLLSPAAGQRVTNTVADVTITGKAGDNVQVTNVLIQLNGGNWVSAVTTNAFTNWTAVVTPVPGTNNFNAFATDASGNVSLTNRRSFIYVVKAPLVISATGQGTISPNYSNALLEVGRAYSITAAAINGHKFVNWVISTNGAGGTASTNATQRFMMVSNLMLQANFLDIKRPTLIITSPVSSQRLTNTIAQISVQGRAGDNAQVAKVRVQLNSGAWTDALSNTGWTNWTATLTPVAATNTVAAYATDATGNNSLTNRVTFIYVVPDTLALITNGTGSITRSFKGNVLEVGRAYTVTAIPGPGQVFSNWVGSLTSTSAVLNFVMQSNMVLQANLIPNPFLPAKGVYNGLFAEAVRSQQRSGFFTLTLADHGAYSASLKRGTNSYPFGGQFDLAGAASKTVNGWLVNMNLDLAAADKLTGTVSSNGWSADLLANRAVFSSTNQASQFKGKFTLRVPGLNTAVNPAGDGYAAVTVTPAGVFGLNGTLADGTPWNQNVSLSRDGECACYVPLYGGQGSVWSWLLFDTNQPAAELEGALSWIKPPRPGSGYYPLGFTNDTIAQGSRYLPPVNATTRVVNLTNGFVVFDGGNLDGPFTNTITLTSTNRIINGSANSLNFSLTLSNGTFAGRVNVPGTARTNTFKGAFLQDQNSGFGYFLGTNQSGSVFIGPQP